MGADRPDSEEHQQVAAGWHPDPWREHNWRYHDGSVWTGHVTDVVLPRPDPSLSDLVKGLTRADWLTASVAALAGILIWVPTMAVVPRYSDTESGSAWLFPLTLGAVLVLAVLLPRSWSVIAPAMALALLLLAPFTAPRGDTTGLWVLIFPFLVAWGMLLHLVAWISSRASRAMRAHDGRGSTGRSH